MNDIIDITNEEEEDDTSTVDQSLYIRHTPQGPRNDYVMKETTSYGKDMPETVKEYITQEPVDCGHPITKETPFGCYCNGRKWIWSKTICQKETCALCMHPCPRCGIFVSRTCCAKPFGAQLICTTCRQKLVLLNLFTFGLSFLLKPFIGDQQHEPSEQNENLVQQEPPTADDNPSKEFHHSSPAYGTGTQINGRPQMETPTQRYFNQE